MSDLDNIPRPDLVLLSGSRAYGFLSPLSDWDYLVFGSRMTFFETLFDLREHHWPEHTDVIWASPLTQNNLRRSICFAQVAQENKPGFFRYILRQIYPSGHFPTYAEAQAETAKARQENIRKYSDNPKALCYIVTNFACQRAKFLRLHMPETKKDFATQIPDRSLATLLRLGETWVSEIEEALRQPPWPEIGELDQEIGRYVFQYGLSRPEDLEAKIKAGTIEGHPAWEDVIGWANLLDFRQKELALWQSS